MEPIRLYSKGKDTPVETGGQVSETGGFSSKFKDMVHNDHTVNR